MTGNENIDPERSDHSPLVYHLRFVHLAIIIVSLAVFTFSVMYDQTTIDQATAEAAELQKLLDKRYWNGRQLNEACNALFKQNPNLNKATALDRLFKSGKGKLNLTTKLDGKDYIWQLSASSSDFKLQCSIAKVEQDYKTNLNFEKDSKRLDHRAGFVAGYRLGAGIGYTKHPNTVEDILKVWQIYNNGIDYYRIKDIDLDRAVVFQISERRKPIDEISITHRGLTQYTLADVAEDSVVARGSVRLKRVLYPKKMAKLFGYESVPSDLHMYIYADFSIWDRKNNENYSIAIPLKSEHKNFSFLPALVQKRKINTAKLGDFADSFPALNKIIQEHGKDQSEVPEGLQILVDEHQKERKRTITIMGTAVEVNSLLKTGATIILSLMLYYVLNLRALVYKLKGDNQAFAVAWIGIYPDRTSYLFTLLTVIVIPFAVSIVQLIVTFDITTLEGQIISGATVFALVIVSLAILIQSYKLFNKVRRFATRVRQ